LLPWVRWRIRPARQDTVSGPTYPATYSASLYYLHHTRSCAASAQGAHGGGVGSSSRCRSESFCFELLFSVVGVGVELCLVPWCGLRRMVRSFSANALMGWRRTQCCFHFRWFSSLSSRCQPVVLVAFARLAGGAFRLFAGWPISCKETAVLCVALGALAAVGWGFHRPSFQCKCLSALLVHSLSNQRGFAGLALVCAAWYRPSYPAASPPEAPPGPPRHRQRTESSSVPRASADDLAGDLDDLSINRTAMDVEFSATETGANVGAAPAGVGSNVAERLVRCVQCLAGGVDCFAEPGSNLCATHYQSQSSGSQQQQPGSASVAAPLAPPPAPAQSGGGAAPAGVPPPPAPVRWRCPVPGCPQHSQESDGYPDLTDLRRRHLDYHAVGTAVGAIPADFMHFHRLIYCGFCSRTLSTLAREKVRISLK